ncbi:MAG: TetR/AcrR family transcriptional regulator [bacterium]
MSSEKVVEPRRQDRGKQRMESLLRAAEEVFAEVGYDRATTNLIASRAVVSPGTLYQFYPNKEAIAEALAAQYAQELELLHASVFHGSVTKAPLSTLIDTIVDPFLAFHRGAPAFEALFLAAAMSPQLAGRIHVLHDTVALRLMTLFEKRSPRAKQDDLRWAAEAAIAVFRGMLPIIAQLKGVKRARAIRELKAVLSRYLEPVIAVRRR